MRDKILLRQLQQLPLDAKILMTQQRIREWYNHFNGDVCISFSGGKDSTVLAHLVHQMYPDVPLVFANTGLEYPEIQAFARKMGAEFVRPKMSFSEVISKYGYPIIGKEVAEAIHFARRIVLSGGVYRQTRFKRIEIRGQRTDGNGRSWRDNGRTNCLLPPRRNCTDGQDGDGRTSQGTLHRQIVVGGREQQIPKEEPQGTRRSKTEQQRHKERARNNPEKVGHRLEQRELRQINRARRQLTGGQRNRGE